jgi:hypothetical protein
MRYLIAVLFCVLVSGCFPNYSNGTRVGVVTKLSEKGMLVKSWEGELLVALPASVAAVNPEKFVFSADEVAVPALKEAMKGGKRVELTYHQWKVKPPTISTEYVVTSVGTAE